MLTRSKMHIDGVLHLLLLPELFRLLIQNLLGDATLVLVCAVQQDPELLASSSKPISATRQSVRCLTCGGIGKASTCCPVCGRAVGKGRYGFEPWPLQENLTFTNRLVFFSRKPVRLICRILGSTTCAQRPEG